MPFKSQIDQEARRFDRPPGLFFALLVLFVLGVSLHSYVEWRWLTPLTIIAGLCALLVYVHFTDKGRRG